MPEPAPSWARLGSHGLQEIATICSTMRELGRANESVEVIDGTGFTVRDEANAITAFAFRNGYLEHLHAGASGFSDEQMKKLMIESSAKLAQIFVARDAAPELYTRFLLEYGAAYSSRWDREAESYELAQGHVGSCSSCRGAVRTEWTFCASCGERLPALVSDARA